MSTTLRPQLSFDDGGVRLSTDTSGMRLPRPILVEPLGGEIQTFAYESVSSSGDAVLASARIATSDGSVLRVDDVYTSAEGAVRVERIVVVEEVGEAAGLRVGIDVFSDLETADESQWQYFIAGQLYNRNDNDLDGREDYLGTYVQDVRDDKNGTLAVLARHEPSGFTTSLARLNRPTFDTSVSDIDLSDRFFVQETDIGSLGVAPSNGGQVRLRASFPFFEENSFSLDTDASAWAAFAPNRLGVLAELTYELRLTATPDLTEAIWDLYQHQYQMLGTARPAPDVTFEESLEHRQMLTQLYYRDWAETEDARKPAGYLVHFSPRTGETQGSLIEFGFSGDQSLLAYAQTVWGQEKNVPLYVDRAASVIDFFVEHFQHENGYSEGIYDPLNGTFTQWFTGILMPFQYASDSDDIRRHVGRQIAGALAPIAEELRTVDGNYLRTMCESIYPILLTYKRNPQGHGNWLKAGRRFGDFLLRTQAHDGSWFRAYSPDGDGLMSPAAWFGGSYLEQKTGTIFPIPVLTTLFDLTGDDRYLSAARAAADFIISTYVDPVMYAGGLNDTTHIKSVKTDSVGLMFVVRSLWKAYVATGEQRFLDGAAKAGKILSSWVFLWDVPFPEGTLLAQGGFKSTGWAVCDSIAGGGYLDNEFLEFTGDLANVAVAAGEPGLLDVSELVQYGMQYALSTPTNDHGYIAPGIQCEGVMTSYWLSAPDTTSFSGAVAKHKGDDNDTCNALTNGQAAYGIYDLRESFGTLDYDEIRAKAFGDA
ncbi:hypothetical protein [Humibacter albus]|uniref:hypothetical protein n=1 Tax=Humibacter albus TaxID=427754 RepID=UPI0003B4405A|nr:hypothetical protein [Humibacter albus]